MSSTMTPDPLPMMEVGEGQQDPFTSLYRRIFGTIQNKIVLPFLLLTLGVTVLGTFVVTRLVAASLQDRLTTQLLETSRAASDSIVSLERHQLDVLRLVVFTVGLPDALEERDTRSIEDSLIALGSNQNVYVLLAFDLDGTVIGSSLRAPNGDFTTGNFDGQTLSTDSPVQPVLNEVVDEFGDKYAGVVTLDGEPILLTVAPVRSSDDRLVGAVGMGTPVQEVLSQTKLDTLADLTLYDSGGAAIRTTFVLADAQDLSNLSIAPSIYVRTMEFSEQSTSLETFALNAREYQTAFVPLVIRRDTLGVLGVSWPSTLITSVITTNRTGLGIIFSVVALMVVLIGYGVALNLTRPIRRLADVAQRVAAGDFSQQSQVRTSDEIGVLGRIFDTMTLNLNDKTEALIQSYEEQERRAAFLLAVISSTADGTVVIDPDTRIIHQNPAARGIMARDDVLWQTFFHELPDELEGHPSLVKRVEVADTWIEAKAAPVVTTQGDKIGIVVALRDVTDEVLTDRMRSGFILQMSHELYTPLVAARGFNELAMKVIDDKVPVAHELLERSMESLGTLRSLIGQILDVSRMLRGGFDIKREPLDLALILEEVVAEHRSLMQSKQLRLQMDIGPLSLYSGGEDPLRWAFRHLVKNACDYTLPEGIIRISAAEVDREFVLKVRDTGVGITRYEKGRIFDQFYRGQPTAKDGRVIDVRGAGLGLFVVSQVAKAHGGAVDVWSEQGIGSEFTFRIPYEPPSIDEEEARTTSRRAITGER